MLLVTPSQRSPTTTASVAIPSVERPWLFEAEGFSLPNHEAGRILPAESQMKTIKSTDESLVNVTGSSISDYDSADESNSTFKAETLKGVTINEPTSAPAKGNKNVSASKKNSAPVGKLKNVKTEDDIPLSVVIKELNDLKLQINKNPSSYSRNNKPQHVKTHSKQNTKHN
ncbi:hypothetical protein Tco_1388340 [Tanacetum coccineum]